MLKAFHVNIWRLYLYSYAFRDFWFRRNSLISNCYPPTPPTHPRHFSICHLALLSGTLMSLHWYQRIFIHIIGLLGGVVDSASYCLSEQGGPRRPASQMKKQRSRTVNALPEPESISIYLQVFSDSHSFIINILWISKVKLDCEISFKALQNLLSIFPWFIWVIEGKMYYILSPTPSSSFSRATFLT